MGWLKKTLIGIGGVSFSQFDDTEMQALYAYLMALPPTAFGGR